MTVPALCEPLSLFNDKNPAGYRAASSAPKLRRKANVLDAGSQPALLCRLFAIDIQSDLSSRPGIVKHCSSVDAMMIVFPEADGPNSSIDPL